MNRMLPPVALVVALAAIAITLLKRPETQTPAAAQNPAPDAALLQRVTRIEAELAQANRTIVEQRALLERLQRRPTASSAPVDAGLAERVAALEQQSRELTQFTNGFDQYGVVSSMEAELVNAYTTLMDTNQSMWNRLKTVGQLKRYRYFDDKALQAVADIYRDTDNFNQKGQALAAMKGVEITPAFRDQILADLNAEVEAGNQSARFRYHAIEALEPLRDDPAVQEWLTHLAQNDPQEKLANRAGQALGGETAKPAR